MEFIVLYCSLLYRSKKVKNWLEGTARMAEGGKVTLYDDSHTEIDSVFIKTGLEVGKEFIFDRHLVLVENKNDPSARPTQSYNQLPTRQPLRQIGLRGAAKSRGNGFKPPLLSKPPQLNPTQDSYRPINQQQSSYRQQSHSVDKSSVGLFNPKMDVHNYKYDGPDEDEMLFNEPRHPTHVRSTEELLRLFSVDQPVHQSVEVEDVNDKKRHRIEKHVQLCPNESDTIPSKKSKWDDFVESDHEETLDLSNSHSVVVEGSGSQDAYQPKNIAQVQIQPTPSETVSSNPKIQENLHFPDSQGIL